MDADSGKSLGMSTLLHRDVSIELHNLIVRLSGPREQGELVIKVSMNEVKHKSIVMCSNFILRTQGPTSNDGISKRARENCRMSKQRWLAKDWRYGT